MNKILQKNKLYKIIVGVMVFLCAGMNVNAAFGMEIKNVTDTTIDIIGKSWGGDTFKNVYLYQCMKSGKNYYTATGADRYLRGFRSENTAITHREDTISIKGWPKGTYTCSIAFQILGGGENEETASFTKNKAGSCSEYKTTECAGKSIDTGKECVLNSNKKCVEKTSSTTARGGYYFCGGACKYYSEGSALGTDCVNKAYGKKASCEQSNNIGIQTSCTDKQFSYNNSCWEANSYNCKYFAVCGKESKCDKYCSNDEPSSPTSPFKVQFNEYGGYGLACDAGSGFTVPSGKVGICEKNVKAGETVTYPKTSATMSKGDNLLIGWTKIKDNCNKGVVEKDLSKVETINASTNFYACYQEIIGDKRTVMSNSSADGNKSFDCGTEVFIEYCTIEENVGYCYYYDKTNGTYNKIYRDKIVSEYKYAGCSSNSNEPVNNNDLQYVLTNGKNFSCGAKLNITSCTDTYCTYSKIVTDASVTIDDGTIDKQFLTTDISKVNKECSALEKEVDEFKNITECSGKFENETVSDKKGEITYKLCYLQKEIDEDYNDSIIKKLSKTFSCADGYSISKIYNLEKEMTCNDYEVCVNNFSVTCSKPKIESKPNLSVTSGIAQNGKGIISVKAAAKEGRIDSYYISEYYKTPTNSSRGWIDVDSDKFTIEHTPGVLYIWVRDHNGEISNAVTGAVIDTVNTNTTISDLELYDANGNLKTPVSSVSYKDTIKSSKYVLMSNDLGKDSEVLADGFNPFDMEYKIEVESPTLAVYATLTSTDSSYVPGYEPRTVNLEYGINTILIKIKNKEGIIRTYTILATRVDDRTSDNTLSDLSVSEGNINFNANVTDYKVEISKDTKSVMINSTIGSDKASYVSGYEPGNVNITGDTTVKLIKVKSETGSTRTYVITFVKKGTDIIEKESLQLADLVISNVNIPFEKNVANYSISVGYETDVIDILTTKMNKDSIVAISIKRKSESSYSTSSGTGMALDIGENFIELKVINSENEVSYYRITIIRKEFGLEISNDTTLKDLKVLGYNIDFEPNKKEYTVKIKQEKTLVITAVPLSNRAEVFIRGNDELTGFSTVRVKVIAENGEYETYSIDIKKDAFNKTIEIAAIVAGVVIILVGSSILIVKKKNKARKEYFEE